MTRKPQAEGSAGAKDPEAGRHLVMVRVSSQPVWLEQPLDDSIWALGTGNKRACLAKGENAWDGPTGHWRQERLCIGLGKRWRPR